jgi:NifU-like protein involved in Fe-S cluster formation
VPAIASGSALTELIAGKTLDAATQLKREDLLEALGQLPPASHHASHLAIDALAALLRDLKSRYRVPSGQ